MDRQQHLEDAYLTLINDRESYERMIKKFSNYRDGNHHWDSCIYLIAILAREQGFSNFDKSTYRTLTEQLHEHYKEEVYGTHVPIPNTTQSTFDRAQAYANKQIESLLTKEEPTMSHELIENKTLINGTDISTMSDSQVFTAIADAEQVIKNLEAITNQPQKLKDQVAKLKADIALVVKAVDAR